jgi:thioredoxin-like negative regulator of GroEL
MIKKILFPLLLVSIASADSTAYIKSLTNNIQKPIVVLIKQNNCRYCEKQLNVINNSVLREYLDKNFQFTTINRSNDMLPAELMDSSVSPTIYVVSKKGKILDEMKGLQQSNNLLRRLNRTLYQVDR